ncbi:MAG: secretin N-terminal domain-containing protein, partial [Deltaproteobacteria bacterium]|nr:secretin N-terminal domain-containing protein [Deltaproteobacteria bacterium]
QARPAPEPLVTRVVNIDYTDAKKLTENLLDLLPKDKDGKIQGSVKVDEHSNALIIQATRQDMSRLFPIIDKIDKPTAQILIKANIVETTKDTARNLGIQWGGMWGQKIGNQGLYVNPGGTGGIATAPGSAFTGAYSPTSGVKGVAGQGFGVNFPAAMSSTASASLGLMFGTIGENILDLQLNALQKDGKLNILSSPSITTLDNQKAFTENGEKIPFVTTDSSGGTLTKSVKFENAVLRLEITPHVIDGKNLKMKILVQKDEVDPSRNVDGNPYIIKKQTETNLIVQDGETIVISGLTKQKNIDNINGVPWLKDIPLLGWLFKGEGKSESMEEVLIFITPNIMKPQEVAGIQTGP